MIIEININDLNNKKMQTLKTIQKVSKLKVTINTIKKGNIQHRIEPKKFHLCWSFLQAFQTFGIY